MVKVEKVRSFYENLLFIISVLYITIGGKELTVVTFYKFTKTEDKMKIR